MRNLVKQIIEKTILYHPLRNWVIRIRDRRELVKWHKNGCPIPPPHIVKQQTLITYAMKYGLRILVETGTYYGDMVQAMKGYFDQVYSIELSEELYGKAKKRFNRSKNIKLICGDSAIELLNITEHLNQPALFWLDGHYSAGETVKGDKNTPIYEELSHILSGPDKGHVIIIDDARCFGKELDYPSLQALMDFIRSKRSNLDIVVQDDSIRIAPL
jgi:hypothetical protein